MGLRGWRQWDDPRPPAPDLPGDRDRYCARCDRVTGWLKDSTGLHFSCGVCGATLSTELTDEEFARLLE